MVSLSNQLVGEGDDAGAGVGDAGDAGFGHEAHVVAFGEGLEEGGEGFVGGVFVEFVEDGVVEAGGIAQEAEGAAGGADVFDDEMAEGIENWGLGIWDTLLSQQSCS